MSSEVIFTSCAVQYLPFKSFINSAYLLINFSFLIFGSPIITALPPPALRPAKDDLYDIAMDRLTTSFNASSSEL